ncbi:MAG: hypothetical protein ACXVXB_01200 [Nocardioidaceae bacterium]
MTVELGRRGFLVAGCLVLGGCTAGGQKAGVARPAPRPGRSPGALSGSPAAHRALPAVTRWRPDRGDLVPAAKLAAVRLVERHGNTRDRALQVIDAQYGGLLADAASVLVVCRSWTRRGDRVVPDGHTFDVRLSRAGARWRVTAVHPSRPGPPAPQPSDAARAVLANRRIALPPAAHADVLSGRVHDSVLTALLTLARRYRIGVSVVRSGHPLHVFGTDRLSDHPQGKAFDTWRIDGQPVVDPSTSRRLVTGYMEAAAAAGSYNVGGPYLLGAAPQFFSDATHHDHVHAGFAT